MENLTFQFSSAPSATAARPAICGVVGSGNLEILIRPDPAASVCTFCIQTSARGFGKIWEAVASEFAARNAAGGTHITIHDLGATPAVVTLRLAQALRDYTGDSK